LPSSRSARSGPASVCSTTALSQYLLTLACVSAVTGTDSTASPSANVGLLAERTELLGDAEADAGAGGRRCTCVSVSTSQRLCGTPSAVIRATACISTARSTLIPAPPTAGPNESQRQLVKGN